MIPGIMLGVSLWTSSVSAPPNFFCPDSTSRY